MESLVGLPHFVCVEFFSSVNLVHLYSLCCWYVKILAIGLLRKLIHQKCKVYTAQSSVIPFLLPISFKLKLTFLRLHFQTFAELGKLKVPYSVHFKRLTDVALTHHHLGSLDSRQRPGRGWRCSYRGYALHYSTPLAHWVS